MLKLQDVVSFLMVLLMYDFSFVVPLLFPLEYECLFCVNMCWKYITFLNLQALSIKRILIFKVLCNLKLGILKVGLYFA